MSGLSAEERGALRGLLQWHVVADLDDLCLTVERIVAARVEGVVAAVQFAAMRVRHALRATQPAAEGASTPEASASASAPVEGARQRIIYVPSIADTPPPIIPGVNDGTCPDHRTIPRVECACAYEGESQ